jgi:hypothetical protein
MTMYAALMSMTPAETARIGQVFDLVKSPNWKDPIFAFVPATAATEEEITNAVVFFAGGEPMVEVAVKDGVTGWSVSGAGYYHWIGG